MLFSGNVVGVFSDAVLIHWGGGELSTSVSGHGVKSACVARVAQPQLAD